MKGEDEEESESDQIIKKKKIEIEEESIDPSRWRNWADLTDAVLISIVDRLFPSLPDLFAFAGVCYSWRYAAATSSSAYRGPPLLLTPLPSPPLRWSCPARCRIQTLTGNNNDDGIRCVRSYKLVSSETLTTRCVGCSHSQLIFVLAGQNAALIDVFTGREIQSPNFPKLYKEFCLGILTAPLGSSSCSLLLVAAHDTFLHYPTSVLCWRPGTSRWSELQTGKYLGDTIGSMVVFKGRVFALTKCVNLIVVEFVPCMSWKDLKIRIPASIYTSHGVSDSRLVECGGDLLLVITVEDRRTTRTPSVACIGVYRLDLSKAMWVKINSLGDWCLFVDAIRNHAVSCPSPTSWGGRNNCIYFAASGCDSWIVVPLDGKPVEKPIESARFSRLETFYFGHSNWSSPFWVYPRLGGIQMEARAALSEPSEDDALLQDYLRACTTAQVRDQG